MRQERSDDFIVESSVGDWRFGRRTVGDAIRIRAAYSRYVGPDVDEDADDDMIVELRFYASAVSAISVLCVSAPNGWERVADINLTDRPDAFDVLSEVYTGLVEKERSFRSRQKGQGEKVGSGDRGDAPVLVPTEVQPTAQ